MWQKIIATSISATDKNVPIIMMSGTEGVLEELVNKKELALSGVLEKPINFKVLHELLIKIFKGNKDSKRILFVDDSSSWRSVFPDKLVELLDGQAVVDTAETGIDASWAVQQNKYDLIITDLKMPVMRGDEFVMVVRNGEWHEGQD